MWVFYSAKVVLESSDDLQKIIFRVQYIIVAVNLFFGIVSALKHLSIFSHEITFFH